MSLFVWNLIPELSGLDDPAGRYDKHLQDTKNCITTLVNYLRHSYGVVNCKMTLQVFAVFSFRVVSSQEKLFNCMRL